MRRRTPVIVRLGQKIGPKVVNVPELGPCWPFAGARSAKGYGVIRDDAGRLVYAHRVALAIHLGRPLYEGMFANHRCDIKECIRPTHLYEGTKSQNELDKYLHVRPPKGDTIWYLAGGAETSPAA